MLTIPPLTQNGKTFRLTGLGMPKLKGGGRGNLFARLRVQLPERLDERSKELFEQLKEAGV
jgi:DnaJ-class molecular chaperone